MKRNSILAAAIVVLLTVACGGPSVREKKQKANAQLEAVYNSKDYQRMLSLADSLEKVGDLSTVKANYWRGYAYDHMKKKDLAEKYWKISVAAGEASEDVEDNIEYAKSASRLANIMCVRGDYDETMKMAQTAVDRLKTQKCDTTSDYMNLLIYIGCCQVVTGQQTDKSRHGLYCAYDKHLENVRKKHTDGVYKDAIAGLITVAYYCVKAHKYEEALYYTRHFGELLGEYELRPGISEEYVDRQLGRYDIYKAQALKGLGRNQEAAETFKAFQATQFSKSSEGKGLAENYLKMDL